MSNCRLVLTCAIVVTLCVVLVGPMAAMAAPPAESAESDITVWDPREPTKDPPPDRPGWCPRDRPSGRYRAARVDRAPRMDCRGGSVVLDTEPSLRLSGQPRDVTRRPRPRLAWCHHAACSDFGRRRRRPRSSARAGLRVSDPASCGARSPWQRGGRNSGA